MFLKKDRRPNGRLYLSIVEGYRDPITKKNKQRKVKTVGFLDELEKEYEDPISYFSNLAKEMTEEAKKKISSLDFSFSPNETIPSSTVLRKNLGFAVLSYFYHELGIDNFFINRQRNLNIKYSLNNIFQMLVYSRILHPSSKKNSYENMDRYFLDFNFKISDVCRSLDYFYKYKNDLLLHIHEMVRMNYGRDTSQVYYDVTNYYFEIKDADDFRKTGVSKEHRTTPIVQMGLLMDNSGLPIAYKLFKGNTNDSTTLMPALHELKGKYNLGRVIVVADKGINTGENIAYNIINKNGYIYSQTVKDGSKEVKNYVLSNDGYQVSSDGFKIKSRIVTTKIWIENDQGKRVQVEIDQKQVAFYSPDSCDKKTGEVYEKTPSAHFINEAKIADEEKYDGYYLIVTSELKMSNQDILNAYRGLWKIEETFKITKSELETRPVYVSLKEHIEAYLLTCFVSLLLLRLTEIQSGNKYSTKKLTATMKNISGTYVDKNYYMFDHYDEVAEKLGKVTNINFARRFMTLVEIKKIISDVKK